MPSLVTGNVVSGEFYRERPSTLTFNAESYNELKKELEASK